MPSTVCWTTFAEPKTLFNVGSEAVCMLCDNILCFTDLKTRAVSYYKAESPELGLSIQAATGHNKFPLVAFCELILMPSVHIIEYPKFSKYAVFSTQNIITFVDIRFSDYDLLVALSGYPRHTFCIWNFRTGQLVLQHDTFKGSSEKSILCSFHHTPQIAQYSEWNHEITVWELCYNAADVDLYEVSNIQLSKDFRLSDISSICYGEDNRLYVVDNLANLFLMELGQFHLKPQWSPLAAQQFFRDLQRFSLESYRQGLLVYSQKFIFYLRRKQIKWHCEWQVLERDLPTGIRRCLFNGNGEIYASASEGNLYHMEVQNETIRMVSVQNHKKESSIDFVVLTGVKEECLLQLTSTSHINALAVGHYAQYSRMEIPHANSIVAHNMAPHVIVGTSKGSIHFVNYSDIREPFIITSIRNEKSYPIRILLFLDKIAVYSTTDNDFRLIRADIANSVIHEVIKFEKFGCEVGINSCFLAENCFFIFLKRDLSAQLPHANLMYCYRWYTALQKYEHLEFDLPFSYRDVTRSTKDMGNVVEFFAIRFETNILDHLNFKMDTNELEILSSMQSNHLSHINCITSSINLLTSGVDGTFIHYRTHEKSHRAYAISQRLQIKHRSRVVKKVLECYMAKYLVYMYRQGDIKVLKVSTSETPIIENSFINDFCSIVKPNKVLTHAIDQRKSEASEQHTLEELQAREKLIENVHMLRQQVTDLINYDLSVTGRSQGMFKKFCLNHRWLAELTKEARKLYQIEREYLNAAIKDQSRIRDWIYFIITNCNTGITFNLRAILSRPSVENFGLSKSYKFYQLFDLCRFYEPDSVESEDLVEGNLPAERQKNKSKITYFHIEGEVYDHIMRDELALQDVNIVTGNQMFNQDAKLRILLIDRLKCDFNKQFEEIRQIKYDLMNAISGTNSSLIKIYYEMNCMLRLLGKAEFEPPQLIIPEWQKDEFVKSIMEVNDSEIKAVNRHKKKTEIKAEKQGRLLLWSEEFWQHALHVMMDGVLEKLFVEEIKKDIPFPEALIKKNPTQYTLEEQRILKDYEEKCRVLEEDRKKYLQTLMENESKTIDLKNTYILKLNENITQLMITKLKYDFAIHHVRLRNFNTKMMYFKKLKWLDRINILRSKVDAISEYIQKYSKLHEFWSKSVDDFRLKIENLTVKEKTIERQYKGQFLNSIPQHLGPEMNKAFKRRPKVSPKLLNSILICKELATRVNSKSQPKYLFPLPKDFYEYLDSLNSLDDISNISVSLESKLWDSFTKLRRQKVEIELKARAITLQLADTSSDMNSFGKELSNLKNAKVEGIQKLQEAQEEYLKSIQDQTLQLRLTMGQVEFNIMGSLKNLEKCVLINRDDVDHVNELISKAGQRKIKAMQKVASFRRQVIYKEWEHKVVSANMEYLNNMLYVIGKCKVSKELLNILRNWNRIKTEKQKLVNTVGVLERVAEEKLESRRSELARTIERISQTRQQINEMKKVNKRIDRQIEQMKISVAFSRRNRDDMMEEKIKREQNEKMEKMKCHSILIEDVRRDYVHIMELKTILELQRLRTYPTLGPNPRHCLN